MFEPIRIAPSILSADFANLGRDVENIAQAGAGFIHVDVMDGHFVPNLTMGVPVVKALKRVTDVALDVHLMIDNPLVEIPWFVDAGSDLITVHAESLSPEELIAAVSMIIEAGVQAAVSIKPKTPVCVIEPVIDQVAMVLVMSVEPGFSGQSYIAGSEDKVAEVVAMSKAHNVSPLIEVDGGVGVKTAPLVAAMGADVLVCGNAVFGAQDPGLALQEIQRCADEARLRVLGE